MTVTTVMMMVRDLLLPRGCAGCDSPDQVLCRSCRDLFAHTVTRPAPGTLEGTGYSCAWYRGEARRAILSWKDHGDEECDPPFAALLADLAVRSGAVSGNDPVHLVPAPSSRASMIRRGRWHMRDLTALMATALADLGYETDMLPVLRTGHVATKSVQTTNAAQRAARITGNVHVTDPARCAGRRMILVDDIITTGATMRQCAAALEQAGANVVTTLTLASVPK